MSSFFGIVTDGYVDTTGERVSNFLQVPLAIEKVR